MRGGPSDKPLVGGLQVTVIGEWPVMEELNQRLGCAALSALSLPLWFLLLALAVPSNLAMIGAGLLFVISLPVGPMMLRRSRRLPRLVRIEVPAGSDPSAVLGAELVLVSRSGATRRALGGLRKLEVTTSVGPWPIILSFADGSRLRLPAEVVDLEGLLGELSRRCKGLEVLGADRLEPTVGRGADGASRP